MRTRSIIATALVCAAAAGPAVAAPERPNRPGDGPWLESPLFWTSALSCDSITLGDPRSVQTTAGGAATEGAESWIPHAGEVFYVRAFLANAGDVCGGGTQAVPEFVVPDGVDFAIDGAHPVRWRYLAKEGAVEQTEGVVLGRTALGGLVVRRRGANGGEPWPLPNTGEPLEFKVPVRSARRLNGIASRAPECDARDQGYGPCRPDESGDHLQVAVQSADGGVPDVLVPIVGMFAREPATPALSGVRRTRGGVLASVRTAPRATVVAAVRRGGRTVGRARVTAGADGRAVLRVRARAGRGAVLRVVATAIDGAASPAASRPVR